MDCLELCCVEDCCDCDVPALAAACSPVRSCVVAVELVGMLAEDSRAGRSCDGDAHAFQLRIRYSASSIFAKMSLFTPFSVITTDVGLPMDIIANLVGCASASAM